MAAKLIVTFVALFVIQAELGAHGQAPQAPLTNTQPIQNNAPNPAAPAPMPAGQNAPVFPAQGGLRSTGPVTNGLGAQQPPQQQAPAPVAAAPASINNPAPAVPGASIRSRRQAGIPPECCTKDPCDPCATTPCIACPRCG